MKCQVCEIESKNNKKCKVYRWKFVCFSQEPTQQEQIEHAKFLENCREED